ncbi:uncharacterized protein LOC126896860 isoform X2 [Daktulosphaira vitifoliae]|uniref:uncharacterized protein LOC126896860 isoform X2 n=1 Tax=Daktulosphaira vitifoliae TaxID=58002 RepID=UPI0021A9CB94|nr:uncharacterized protein LOC126896860 isoform X2 [Daktulosphaira vitifoliae]
MDNFDSASFSTKNLHRCVSLESGWVLANKTWKMSLDLSKFSIRTFSTPDLVMRRQALKNDFRNNENSDEQFSLNKSCQTDVLGLDKYLYRPENDVFGGKFTIKQKKKFSKRPKVRSIAIHSEKRRLSFTAFKGCQKIKQVYKRKISLPFNSHTNKENSVLPKLWSGKAELVSLPIKTEKDIKLPIISTKNIKRTIDCETVTKAVKFNTRRTKSAGEEILVKRFVDDRECFAPDIISSEKGEKLSEYDFRSSVDSNDTANTAMDMSSLKSQQSVDNRNAETSRETLSASNTRNASTSTTFPIGPNFPIVFNCESVLRHPVNGGYISHTESHRFSIHYVPLIDDEPTDSVTISEGSLLTYIAKDSYNGERKSDSISIIPNRSEKSFMSKSESAINKRHSAVEHDLNSDLSKKFSMEDLAIVRFGNEATVKCNEKSPIHSMTDEEPYNIEHFNKQASNKISSQMASKEINKCMNLNSFEEFNTSLLIPDININLINNCDEKQIESNVPMNTHTEISIQSHNIRSESEGKQCDNDRSTFNETYSCDNSKFKNDKYCSNLITDQLNENAQLSPLLFIESEKYDKDIEVEHLGINKSKSSLVQSNCNALEVPQNNFDEKIPTELLVSSVNKKTNTNFVSKEVIINNDNHTFQSISRKSTEDLNKININECKSNIVEQLTFNSNYFNNYKIDQQENKNEIDEKNMESDDLNSSVNILNKLITSSSDFLALPNSENKQLNSENSKDYVNAHKQTQLEVMNAPQLLVDMHNSESNNVLSVKEKFIQNSHKLDDSQVAPYQTISSNVFFNSAHLKKNDSIINQVNDITAQMNNLSSSNEIIPCEIKKHISSKTNSNDNTEHATKNDNKTDNEQNEKLNCVDNEHTGGKYTNNSDILHYPDLKQPKNIQSTQVSKEYVGGSLLGDIFREKNCYSDCISPNKNYFDFYENKTIEQTFSDVPEKANSHCGYYYSYNLTNIKNQDIDDCTVFGNEIDQNPLKTTKHNFSIMPPCCFQQDKNCRNEKNSDSDESLTDSLEDYKNENSAMSYFLTLNGQQSAVSFTMNMPGTLKSRLNRRKSKLKKHLHLFTIRKKVPTRVRVRHKSCQTLCTAEKGVQVQHNNTANEKKNVDDHLVLETLLANIENHHKISESQIRVINGHKMVSESNQTEDFSQLKSLQGTSVGLIEKMEPIKQKLNHLSSEKNFSGNNSMLTVGMFKQKKHKGKEALEGTKNDRLLTLSKGWINFYTLRTESTDTDTHEDGYDYDELDVKEENIDQQFSLHVEATPEPINLPIVHFPKKNVLHVASKRSSTKHLPKIVQPSRYNHQYVTYSDPTANEWYVSVNGPNNMEMKVSLIPDKQDLESSDNFNVKKQYKERITI